MTNTRTLKGVAQVVDIIHNLIDKDMKPHSKELYEMISQLAVGERLELGAIAKKHANSIRRGMWTKPGLRYANQMCEGVSKAVCDAAKIDSRSTNVEPSKKYSLGRIGVETTFFLTGVYLNELILEHYEKCLTEKAGELGLHRRGKHFYKH